MNKITLVAIALLLATGPVLADGFSSSGANHSRGPATISGQTYQRTHRYDRPPQVIVAPVYIDRYPPDGWSPRDYNNSYFDRYGRFDELTHDPRD